MRKWAARYLRAWRAGHDAGSVAHPEYGPVDPPLTRRDVRDTAAYWGRLIRAGGRGGRGILNIRLNLREMLNA